MKLLALTHNFIGPNAAHQLPNHPIVQGDRVVIPVSGELLDPDLIPECADATEKRRAILDLLYSDPQKLLDAQKPDLVLIYVGMGLGGNVHIVMKAIWNFVIHLESANVHMVWPHDRERRRELYEQLGHHFPVRISYDSSQPSVRPDPPCVHFGEPTGNVTMQGLIDEFLETGTIRDPANAP